MSVQAIVVGLSHVTTPLEVREKFAVPKERLSKALQFVRNYASQAVILSTCNRTEVYTVVADPTIGCRRLEQFLTDYGNSAQPGGEISPYLYRHIHEDAVRHLLRVVSGVDSMVLGEDQILGQVRQAWQEAKKKNSVGSPLSHLFSEALRVGKRVRAETEISRYPASVSYAAVQQAKQIFGELDSCNLLIIGAGETAKLTGRIARDSIAHRIFVTSRNYDKATDMALKLGGKALPFSQLIPALSEADIVISSTGSPEIVLGTAIVKQAKERHPRPLFLIDIAVPRDIDPEVRKLENVSLYDIDDLQKVCQAGLEERRKEAIKVEAIIEGETSRLARWWEGLEAVPTIVALRERAEAIRRQELAKALRKMPSITESDRVRVEILTKAIINKLLHYPTVHLKNGSRNHGYLDTVQQLFDLKDSPGNQSLSGDSEAQEQR